MSNNGRRELAAGRQEKAGRVLRRQGVVSVGELSDLLGVSPATVRRDLLDMERRGLLHRVHGGAVSVEGRLDEPAFDDKTEFAAAEKQRIAKAAERLINPRDSVFLDGGSTILALAALLPSRTDITVVTNSLRVAALLAGSGPRMIVIGGEFRRVSQTFVGSLTYPLIDRLHVDRAFMGTIGLEETEGLTTTDPREAATKERVMAHSRQSVLLADSTKIGQVSFVRFGGIEDVGVLITDTAAPEKDLRGFRKRNVDVVTA